MMLNTFRHGDGLWFGQFEARLRDLVTGCPDVLRSGYLVADILDSASPVAALSAWTRGLDEAAIAWTAVDGRVVFAPDETPRLLAAGRTFHGFDQVWVCSRMPRPAEIPAGRFTSDSASFESSAPEPIRGIVAQPWFTALLADGCGLNVATSSAYIRDAVAGWWSSLE